MTANPADAVREALERAESNRAEWQAKEARMRMWSDIGAAMLGQAMASSAVILNPRIPLADALDLAAKQQRRFFGLASKAFNHAMQEPQP